MPLSLSRLTAKGQTAIRQWTYAARQDHDRGTDPLGERPPDRICSLMACIVRWKVLTLDNRVLVRRLGASGRATGRTAVTRCMASSAAGRPFSN